MGTEYELRRRGVDRDQAGRGIAAAERALRTTEDFDPVDRTEFAKGVARARAVDAVDEHRDRAFEAGIVAHRADAADTRRTVGFVAGRRDQQRRSDLGEFADVVGARFFEQLSRNNIGRDRDVGESLLSALSGYDDRSVIGRFVIGLLGLLILARVLGKGRTAQGKPGDRQKQRGATCGRDCGVNLAHQPSPLRALSRDFLQRVLRF